MEWVRHPAIHRLADTRTTAQRQDTWCFFQAHGAQDRTAKGAWRVRGR